MIGSRQIRSVPLLAWIVLALVLVGLLPFAISAYQIRSSRIAVVDQVQTTHLASARAAADRVASYLELLTAVGESAARNPNLAADPTAEGAQEVLAGLVQARPEILAAGVYLLGETPELVQMAQQAGLGEAVAAALRLDDPRPLATSGAGADLRVRLRVPLAGERAAADLALLLVADAEVLAASFEPVELGEEAQLVLAERGGEVLMGSVSDLAAFPPELVARARSGLLRSEAAELRGPSGERLVGAFADVANSPWLVLSLQPTHRAEAVTRRMRRTAWNSFGVTLLLAALLAAGAQATIVRPIRQLVEAQRRLAGVGGSARGGEIAGLQDSFALLERNLNDREALGKVFLDRYRIIELLGVGAMGSVFRGWDPRLERHVALKTFKIGAELDAGRRQELTERLVKEAVTLARVQHPNIVTVFDVVQDGDAAFIAMELVEGESLERYLWREQRLAPPQAVPLLADVVEALEIAHQQGFVHHDVKPGNVLLGCDGSVKLTDFGVSELLTQVHRERDMVCGTPGYLAPEVLMHQGYTALSDLFAIGVILYECLTGVRPFQGKDVRSILVDTAVGEPAPLRRLCPQASPELASLVDGLLAKEPAERPASAGQVAEVLREMAAAEGWEWSAERVGRRTEPEEYDEEDRLRTALVPARTV